MPQLVDRDGGVHGAAARNNELVEEGAAKNALRARRCASRELGEAHTRRGGETLQAGDLISSGTLTESLPIAAGDTWIASTSTASTLDRVHVCATRDFRPIATSEPTDL